MIVGAVAVIVALAVIGWIWSYRDGDEDGEDSDAGEPPPCEAVREFEHNARPCSAGLDRWLGAHCFAATDTFEFTRWGGVPFGGGG
jgi:hypothetical protein